MLRSLSVALAAALLFSACDSGTPDADQQIVVSALLEAGGPMPDISVSRTLPLGEVYSPEASAIRDADVRVVRLGADADTTRFAFNAETSRYERLGVVSPITPGATYRLEVRADGQALSAETTVPLRFEIVEAPPESVEYLVPQTGPRLRITTSSGAGRQAVYLASTQALAPDEFAEVQDGGDTRYRSRNVPGRFGPLGFVRLFLNCDDEAGGGIICDEDPSGAATRTSPLINEASYTLLGDGTARVDVPWIAFGFYGPSEVSLISLDRAYQDLVEGEANQSGGGTISPGEIPNVTSNVRGGIGVFGSFARVTARIGVREQ